MVLWNNIHNLPCGSASFMVPVCPLFNSEHLHFSPWMYTHTGQLACDSIWHNKTRGWRFWGHISIHICRLLFSACARKPSYEITMQSVTGSQRGLDMAVQPLWVLHSVLGFNSTQAIARRKRHDNNSRVILTLFMESQEPFICHHIIHLWSLYLVLVQIHK